VTHPTIADIEKGLGRLPLMSSRESTDVKDPKYLFQIDGGGASIFSRQGHPLGAAAVSVCKTCTFSYKISYNPAWQKEAVNRGRNWLFNRSNRLLSGRL